MSLNDKTLKALRNGITIAAFSASMESEEAVLAQSPLGFDQTKDKNITMPRDNTNVINKATLQIDPKAFSAPQIENPMNEGRGVKIDYNTPIEPTLAKAPDVRHEITEEEVINRPEITVEPMQTEVRGVEVPHNDQTLVLEEPDLSLKQEMLLEGEAYIESYEEFHTEMHKQYVYAKHGIDTESDNFKTIESREDLGQFINDNLHNRNEDFAKRMRAEKEILEFDPKGKEIDYKEYGKYLKVQDLDEGVSFYGIDMEDEMGRAGLLAADIGNNTEDMQNLGDKAQQFLDFTIDNLDNMADKNVQRQAKRLGKMINKDGKKLLKTADKQKKFMNKVNGEMDKDNTTEAGFMILNKAYKNALKNRNPEQMREIGEKQIETKAKNTMNSASHQLMQQRSGR